MDERDAEKAKDIVRKELEAHAEKMMQQHVDWMDENSFDLWSSRPERDDDSDINLLGNCFLYRGGGAILIGPTGTGKSSFALQACLFWSCGLGCFDIEPERPLKILYFQGEGTRRGLLRRKETILSRFGLDEQFGFVRAVHRADLWKHDFLEFLREMLIRDAFDLVVVDPLFSYLGVNASDQENISRFLRNQLNPMLDRHGCGCIFVHHTPKPSADVSSPLDWVYAGFGSSELPNWARAVLVISRTDDRQVYKLTAAKNGAALGWFDDRNQPIYELTLQHNPEHGNPDSVAWTVASDIQIQKQDVTGSFTRSFRFGDTTYSGVQALIIQTLMAEPTLSPEALAEKLGMTNQGLFNSHLNDLLRKGWERAKYGDRWVYEHEGIINYKDPQF